MTDHIQRAYAAVAGSEERQPERRSESQQKHSNWQGAGGRKMRTFLEQPMRRSDFLKFGLTVVGAFFLCPRLGWERTPLAEAAEETGAHGGGMEETVKVYSVEKKEFVTVGKVVKSDAEWKRLLDA
jgi:hypothetical protein